MKGNEAADETAKLATQLAGPSEVEEYPLETLKTETKRLMIDKWETQFHKTTKAGQLKEIIGTIREAKEWNEATRLDSYLTQVLTGHGGTMAYLKRSKVINTHRCTCGEQPSRDHLIVEYPLTRSAYLKAKSKLDGKERRKGRIAIVAKAFSSMMEQMWHENQKRIMPMRMNGGVAGNFIFDNFELVDTPSEQFFLCKTPNCGKLYGRGTSTAHKKNHILSHQNTIVEEPFHLKDQNVRERLVRKLIVTRGLPYRLSEDKLFRSITSTKMNTAAISNGIIKDFME